MFYFLLIHLFSHTDVFFLVLSQFLSSFLVMSDPFGLLSPSKSVFLIPTPPPPPWWFFHFVSFCHCCCLSVFLTSPQPLPILLDIVLRQRCGLMVTRLCRVCCIVRQLPVLPSAVLTVLSWMNEHTVLTQGATVSNNKSLFFSVKFKTL